MDPLNHLLNTIPYIEPPHQWVGWFGFTLLLVMLLSGLVVERRSVRGLTGRQWVLFAAALLLAVVFGLAPGVRMAELSSLPVPNLPSETTAPTMMILSAVPWVITAGVLGPVLTVIVAAVSGLVLAIFHTHTLFTILELAGLAFFFSIAVKQPYRTLFYRLMRHPIGAGALLSLIYIPFFLLSAFFAANGSFPERLDFALTQNWYSIFSRLLEFLIALLVAEVLYLAVPALWPRPRMLQPSPSEASLQSRFLFALVPLLSTMLVGLLIGDWLMAGRAARNMIEGRMTSAAQVAANSLPYFLESGQSLIMNLAQPDLVDQPPEQLKTRLAQNLRAVPYYRQLFLFDSEGNPLGGYPINAVEQLRLTDEERTGLRAASNGVAVQTYTVPPWPGENTAQISFMAAVKDGEQITGVLLGRTDLLSNPFTQPALTALGSIQSEGGEGLILDESGRILFHTVQGSTLLMGQYPSASLRANSFYDETSPTGTRQMVASQTVAGRPWSVVLTMPALVAQQLALSIAVPLLVILAVLAVVAIAAVSLGLSSIVTKLAKLSGQASRIAEGELDTPLRIRGDDETGRLGASFEAMRMALKDRLAELNRLLTVSQGVASNLQIEQAIQPILEAVLDEDAISARIVLTPDVKLDLLGSQAVAYGLGPSTERFAYMDRPIFEQMRTEKVLLMHNPARVRRLGIPPSKPQPGALIALPLSIESTYYGTLWVAYDQPRNFSTEQVRFFTTLAGEAAMAAANARLYANAEIGRQRMAAVLTSTPEPVLVFDEKDQLLLLNPAAAETPGLMSATTPGMDIHTAVEPQALRELLSSASWDGVSTREISLGQKSVFLASVSPVMAEGHPVGKVCTLRDITHFKELDSLKSDFVATVSHDLRHPLMHMRGQLTMLKMVGELTEQQKAYLKGIFGSVDSMMNLVTSLLDLGRIEAGIGLNLAQFSPMEIVENVIHSLTPQANQKNISISAEVVGQPVRYFEADQDLLQQALSNLVENAIRFTRVNGQVRVRLNWGIETLTFEVHDNGIGIAPLDRPRVFEKFFRSSQRETNSLRGTGLGLAIVKSVAERHGGRARVESQLGKGSSFYMEIPLSPVRSSVTPNN